MPVTVTTLVSFDGKNGGNPASGLSFDANGNVIGAAGTGPATSASVSSNTYGVVFEIAETDTGYASSVTPLVSFTGFDGYSPNGGLIADAVGNLFGTTAGGPFTASTGGTQGVGTIFEIAKTAGGYADTPSILATFTGPDGSQPNAGVVADAAGNLFGATFAGGTYGYGTVFELAKTPNGYANAAIPLVSFNGSDGYAPNSPLIMDASGDLFGTTLHGGTYGQGTVYEILKTPNGYADTPTVLVSFSTGYGPAGGLVADAQGNLFAMINGEVVEITKTADGYASVPGVVASVPGGPDTLTIDAQGNLIGVAGSYSLTLFQIAKTTSGYASTPTTLATIAGGGAGSLTADAQGNLFGTTFLGGTGGYGTVFEVSGLACFAAGTRIQTPQGEVNVEDLAIGDRVRLVRGETAPVIWIGRRHVDCRRHPHPHAVWPVRVRASAFGEGRPRRDLWLSPDHAVFLDDVLIPIRCLLNGTTIAQQDSAAITYFHVELPAHDVILADGLPTESYLDLGNRGAFANSPGVIVLHPDFARRIWEAKACAPQILGGPLLDRVRQCVALQSWMLACAAAGAEDRRRAVWSG